MEMTELSEMRRQRDELSKQIEAAERQAVKDLVNGMLDLEQNLHTWAHDHAVTCEDRTRKNAVIYELNGGTVTVEFNYPEENYSSGLYVRDHCGLQVDFTGGLPASPAFIGLVEGLVNAVIPITEGE
jgi:hypothetical protein